MASVMMSFAQSIGIARRFKGRVVQIDALTHLTLTYLI